MNKQILFSLVFLVTSFCIKPVTYIKFIYAGTDLQHALQGLYRQESKVINSAEEFLNVWDTIHLVFNEENILLAAADGPEASIVNSLFIGGKDFPEDREQYKEIRTRAELVELLAADANYRKPHYISVGIREWNSEKVGSILDNIPDAPAEIHILPLPVEIF